MKSIFYLIISGALIVSGYAQTRNVLVGTNNAVVQPTNFWSADASNARSGLGLGSAATNPASAFQPSSSTLSNLASGNAANLTNLLATSLVGVIPSSNIPSTTLTNISGILDIVSGGTGATNASNARVNLGATSVGNNLFTATNPEAARIAIGALATNGNAINLTNFPEQLLRTNGNGAGLTNLTAINITGVVGLASNVTGTIAIINGGTGATNASGARANLSLGATWLTNTDSASFRSAIGFSTNLETLWTATNASSARSAVGLAITDSVQFGNIFVGNGGASLSSDSGGTAGIGWQGTTNRIGFSDAGITLKTNGMALVFGAGNANGAAISRINLGLGWPALTNTNAGTGLVSVNTNGDVVSPTNFWQMAPIQTVVQNITPVVNATNAATNARTLYVYSLAISTTGVTNVITLPTSAATFNGDEVTVIHMGPTSSVTAIRQLGSANNLITINTPDESVKFIYENNAWTNFHNISFVEPIRFSGTNASAIAAASRTNLELGQANSVSFGTLSTTGSITSSNGYIAAGSAAARIQSSSGGGIDFGYQGASSRANLEVVGLRLNDANMAYGFGANNTNGAAITRTNLGLPLAALTNTNIANFRSSIELGATWLTNTNVTNFRAAIELGETNNVTFSNVTVSGTLTATSTVTAKTNLVVEGFVDFTTNYTNATPATPNTPARWLQIRVGTNVFYLPAHQ